VGRRGSSGGSVGPAQPVGPAPRRRSSNRA
jgi:hypothetical protein